MRLVIGKLRANYLSSSSYKQTTQEHQFPISNQVITKTKTQSKIETRRTKQRVIKNFQFGHVGISNTPNLRKKCHFSQKEKSSQQNFNF